mgnify:CR=1 FL=1
MSRPTASPARPPVRVFGPGTKRVFATSDPVGHRWLDTPAEAGAEDASEFDRKWPAYGIAAGSLAFELAGSGHGELCPPSAKAAGGFIFPTPSACEPDSWRYIDVVDKDGAPPTHPNQRFYNKATGQIVQKTLEHVALTWPTPTAQDARNNGGTAQHARRTPPLNARAGGPLNPVWVEWLMGFPAGWTRRSAPEVPEPSRQRAPDREAAVLAARQAAPEAARSDRSRRRSPHDDAKSRAGEKLRSPRHPEDAS